MKINEFFKSIQGEGSYAGEPVLFIRTSGCTRNCEWCDTKYHIEGEKMDTDILVDIINKNLSNAGIVCFTGGEPLMQREGIKEIISLISDKEHHLETNGDLLENEDVQELFDYIACSPKDAKTARKVLERFGDASNLDIKIVTDLETVGVDMLNYASILMPLTKQDKEESKKISQKVWDYCIEHDITFGQRLHTYIFDVNQRKV